MRDDKPNPHDLRVLGAIRGYRLHFGGYGYQATSIWHKIFRVSSKMSGIKHF